MTSTGYSRYKQPQQAVDFLTQWAQQLQDLNGSSYEQVYLQTDWGKTAVWIHTPKRRIYKTLVFFPGFQSTALAWDINHGLASFKKNYRLCLVEINGQPGLSEGHSPDLHTDEYGLWAAQVLKQLGRATVIGHALGALICLKLCRLAPDLVKQAILINPAGIQSFSMTFSLLRYYWLITDSPSYKSIETFLQKEVFSDLEPVLPAAYQQLMVAYHQHALTEFDGHPLWHQALPKEELTAVQTKLYIILGAQDRLFNYQSTLDRAVQYLGSLRNITVLPTMAHGIQRSDQIMATLQALILTKD